LPTFFPPEPCFAHAAVGTLPLPVHLAEFLAFSDENRPNLLHHAVAIPTLEPTVDGGVVAELLGHVVPLATAPEAMDDAVEKSPPVGWRLATFGTWLPIRLQDRFDP